MTRSSTRKDKIRNEYTRGAIGVAIISSKMTERQLKWFGHVKRRQIEHACGQIIHLKPPGKRGRPRTRWMDAVDRDMKMVGLEILTADDRR